MSVPVLRNMRITDQRIRRQGKARLSGRMDLRGPVLAVLAAAGKPLALPQICGFVCNGGVVMHTTKTRVRLALEKLAAEGKARCLDRGTPRRPAVWEAVKK